MSELEIEASSQPMPKIRLLDLIQKSCTNVPEALKPSFALFVTKFYHHVSEEDLLGSSEESHRQRIQGMWQWVQKYRKPEPKINVYNPPMQESNWRQDATHVEMVLPDIPFIIDSTAEALTRQGLTIHLLQHPVIFAHRDEAGNLLSLSENQDEKHVERESWVHASFERQPEDVLATIQATLLNVLKDVQLSVADWPAMLKALASARASIESTSLKNLSAQDKDETLAFCSWMNDHFVFLGCRNYNLSEDGARLESDPNAERGLMRSSELVVINGLSRFDTLPTTIQHYISAPELLFVNKMQARSTVHRASPFDLVGIRRFHEDGRLAGLHLFLGLFTSIAYSTIAQNVPWLRKKVDRIVAMSKLEPSSHNGKALIHILNNYPRDDLFQIDEANLFRISKGILMLADRVRTALFVWVDPFNRYASCLVFTPRERFDTQMRQEFTRILENGFNGKLQSFVSTLSDSPLVRVQILINLSAMSSVPDTDSLEQQIINAARGWDDLLMDALVTRHGREKSLPLRRRYADAFTTAYRSIVMPERAADDISYIENINISGEMALSLHPIANAPDSLQIRLFHKDTAVALSDIVPRLENMSLRLISEVPFTIRPKEHGKVWVHELLAQTKNGQPIDLVRVEANFLEAFHLLWKRALEDDRFNQLLITPGLNSREVTIMRAYARYLQQIGFMATPSLICDTLANYPHITAKLVQLFHVRFDPAQQPDSTPNAQDKQLSVIKAIEADIEKITSFTEDDVLRRYLNLITSTLRTNYYQRMNNEQFKPYISFKIESGKILDLPLPRPYAEIWVYSPEVEGIHLRGGKVARGGIRWSDRRDDFRTEVLGLMKAQMVKNAVIVPVGSKGGFFCKRLPLPPTQEKEEVVSCYKTFIRGLLDLTDNRTLDGIAALPNVVRHDGEDPYLVVAADKGTARFSDIANSLSLEYGFWLGDAFASGGSAGYDHKEMGITARGAWESVKRHFREKERNIQVEPFTCVGIGDMAGDVFGNGMLRSRVTLLVAAFNHKHIFIDPQPDAAASFMERERLFKLPGSQWSDYNPQLISAGGGVFERSAKFIELTQAIRNVLGLSGDRISPNQLIRAILRADVDLMYLGGIGTYIKATDESHADASDRANDGVRVNANEVRAKVIGEGANLGITARARIELAHEGIAINSDAIDNSAGVDTSDHEVNIKIALQAELSTGALTMAQRNELLSGMTEDVAALVLRNNYLQTEIITLEHKQAAASLEAHARLIRMWEKESRLDRVVSFLPTDDQLLQRAQAGEGLTRPEIAILLAHAKLALCDDIVISDLPDDLTLEADLRQYFPKPMREPYLRAIRNHRLRREIITTVLANNVVNRMGPTFVHGLSERTGHSIADVLRAYVIVRHVFSLPLYWRSIEKLDTVIANSLQIDLLIRSQTFVARTTNALLKMLKRPIQMSETQNELVRDIQELIELKDQILPPDSLTRLQQVQETLQQQGLPADIAQKTVSLDFLSNGLDILIVAKQANRSLAQSAGIYYTVGQHFALDSLRQKTIALNFSNHWQRQEALALVEDLYAWQQKISVCILTQNQGNFTSWLADHAAILSRCDILLKEVQSTPQFDLSMLAMIGRSLRNLAGQ